MAFSVHRSFVFACLFCSRVASARISEARFASLELRGEHASPALARFHISSTPSVDATTRSARRTNAGLTYPRLFIHTRSEVGRNSHPFVTVSAVTANGTLQSSSSARPAPATTASAAPTAKCAWRQTARITAAAGTEEEAGRGDGQLREAQTETEHAADQHGAVVGRHRGGLWRQPRAVAVTRATRDRVL